MTLTQEDRLMTIDTPLGQDVVLLSGFTGTEQISVPYSFELSLVSENHNISFEDIIGANVTVSIVLADGDRRFFNGIISRFSQLSGGGDDEGGLHLSYYTATMVPWLWLLTRTANSRIFQELSVPEIVEQIFTERGFSYYRLNLHENYEKKEYCVQYRETDFNFVSRLLEEEGIYYFFEHADGQHTLILADSPEENRPCPKQDSARCLAQPRGWMEEDVITSLNRTQEIRIGKYTINDYNFEMPATDLKVEVSSRQPIGPGDRELYDYPGLYSNRTGGDRLANMRIQEEEAQITIMRGKSNCRAFSSGYRFHLLEYYRDDMNDNPYVLTSITHGASEPVGGSEATPQESGASYTNSFTCIPFDVPYRPPRYTPKPVVQGTQTAIVVGPSGEEIYTDEHGRVKVQFHWDREGQKDENSSCWIRVSQPWAGAGWGGMFVPHIGHEVIVDFLEGDPDRPIITGRVYHGTNRPADSLPDEKTKSVIRSWGDNNIVIEDKDGDKHIHIKQACGNEILMHETTPNIEIKQACGNQILMRESEGIHMKDKYGNEVKLDAVAGTLKLHSPTHESTIELGKSIWMGTISDVRREAQGNLFSVVHGMKEDYVVGPVKLKWDGTNAKIHGGLVSDTFIGGKHSALIGGQLTTNLAVLIERSKSRSIKTVDSLVKIDSQTETQVIGGGGKADTSKLHLKGNLANLRCGNSYIDIRKDGKISISSQKDIMISSPNEDITLKTSGKKVIIDCSEVQFKCNTIDFGKATLNGGKKGTIFS